MIEKIKRIIEKFHNNNYECFIVGGYVRDQFLNKPSKDIDLTTNAKIDDIINLFKVDYKITTVNSDFKVVIIDNEIEIATYRKDTYFGKSDKNCKIEETKTIQEDLSRRDLTINSIAFCPFTKIVIDPFDGVDDIKNRIIKFTGDPSKRIYEDPCRILRACRFLSKIKGKFENNTFMALKKFSYLVNEIKPERINKEIWNSLTYSKPSIFFQALHDIGALQYIIPELDDCYGHPHGRFHTEDVWEHSMIVGDSISSKNQLLRLVGYLHDIGKPLSWKINNDGSFKGHEKTGAVLIENVLFQLKFSKKDIAFATALTKLHMRSAGSKMTKRGIKNTLKKIKLSNIDYRDWLRLKIADCKGNLKKPNYSINHIKGIINNIQNILYQPFSIKDLKINAITIMKTFNLTPGPIIGNILNQLLYNVLIFPELNDPETLIKLTALKLKHNINCLKA